MDSTITMSSRSSPDLPPLRVPSRKPSLTSSFFRAKSQHSTSHVPISGNLASTVSNNSSRGSLISTNSIPPTNTSMSTSPDALVSYSDQLNGSMAHFALPDPVLSVNPTSPPAISSHMAEAMSLTKSPAQIVRRLSKGAHSRIGRRRTSAANASRDMSAGPVIVRRQSEARPIMDPAYDVSDLELDRSDEEAEDVIHEVTPIQSASTLQSRPSMASSIMSDGLGPVIPARLKFGTMLMKVTRKNKKRLLFRVDFEAAKFMWDSHSSSKQVYIDDVQNVRFGEDAREHRESFGIPTEHEKRWFTIIYTDPSKDRGTIKTLHLLADDERTKQSWVDCINRIQRTRIQTMTNLRKGGERSLKELWRRETQLARSKDDSMDVNPRLRFEEIKVLCRKKLHINSSDNALRLQFNKADSRLMGSLDYDQFRTFIKRLRKRHDLKQIFNLVKKQDQEELDLDSFFSFLTDCQGIDIELHRKYWNSLFSKYCRRCRDNESPPAEDQVLQTMNFPAFQDLMMLPDVTGAINHHWTGETLDRPLSEYYISSSHNTYLPGNQYMDESSTEPYVTTLSKGCRCVEVDCWDGSDGRPIVMHGRSFTTSVLFSDCIKVINEHAFRQSPYPLIISLEVHCNPAQQTIMADIMKRVFAEKLILAPLDHNSTILPSPEALKNKILIKVKATSEDLKELSQGYDAATRRPRRSSSPTPKRDAVDTPSATINIPQRAQSIHNVPEVGRQALSASVPSYAPSGMQSPTAIPLSPATSDNESDVLSEKKRKSQTSRIVQALGVLGVYTKGIKYSGFRTAESRSFNHIYSFAERTFDNICNKEKEIKDLLEKHNRRCLMRVYPSGFRVRSDNFEPLKFWRRGVQMAALNWQTNDLGMQLNTAMFAAGGDQTGYVLKPQSLRPRALGNESPADCRPEKKIVRCTIDIISAQQLPRPRDQSSEIGINPFVQVEVFTAEDKGQEVVTGEGGLDVYGARKIASLQKHTRIVENNGYDPEFHEKLALTVETKHPSLVFVRFTVFHSIDGKTYNNSSTPLARYTAKLDSLQQGYRHIALNNSANERYYFSTLFCRVHKAVVPVGATSGGTSNEFLPMSPPPEPRGGIFKRILSRTPSSRRRTGDNGPTSAPLSMPQTQQSSANNSTYSIRRMASIDSGLNSIRR